MGDFMGSIPVAAGDRILRKAGAERVSKDAAELFVELLEDIGIELGRQAFDVSKHAGRKTIKLADIKYLIRTRNKY